MANTNAPFGLRPLGISLSGGPQFVELLSKDASAGVIYRYDVVARAADGYIEAGGTPGSTLPSGVSLDYGAATTASDHLVLTSPDALFVAQDNGSSGKTGAGVAFADLGLNCNLVYTAGDSTTKQSKHSIAASTMETTNSLDVKLLNLFNVPDNAYGAYARIEIVFNAHRMGLVATAV